MRRTGWCVLAVTAVLAFAGCGADVEQARGSGLGTPGATSVPAATAKPGATPTTTAPPGATPITTGPESTMTDDEPSPRRQPPSSTAAVPEPYLERVIADAADRSGVPPDRLEVIRAQAVQWRDGSLGCPEPGMMYTQAIVDGYWIELAAAGQRFDYRLDGRGNFRLCQQPVRGSPYPGDR